MFEPAVTPTPVPSGFSYLEGVVSPEEERVLLELFQAMTYRDIVMRGQVAKRRVCCFGCDYVYTARAVVPTVPMPPAIDRLRGRVEALLSDGSVLAQAIVTVYPPGAGINWHRDAPVFGPSIVGVSFGSEARLGLKQGSFVHRIRLAPRSAYVLTGPARTSWLHRVAPATSTRYSVTFRSLTASTRP